VVAAPAIAGWSCAVDGGPSRPAHAYLGLVSAPLGAGAGVGTDGMHTVDCAFTPPGLRQGEAVGAASLAGTLGVAAYAWWRRRRGDGARTDVDAVTSADPGTRPAEAVV
jgi:hypothetical protein